EQVIDEFELKKKLKQHPFDLSGGEMQRLGLAKLILEGNDIFLLDEPEKGMDFIAKQRMGHILEQLTMRGKTVLMVSHDVEFCARYADMCGLFFDGSIVSLSDTGEFFQNNIFYTTAIQRMCKNVFPEAVLLEDVVKRETLPEYIQEPYIKKSVQNKGSCKDIEDDVCGPKNSSENNNCGKNDYNKVLIFVIIFVVIPVTIYIGETVLQHRKYYFISLLLVLEAITAFFLEFEKRKPKLRQIMLVAMMTAITVAGRELFYMIPNIKPVAALVILSGISFGGEAGFLIGSMSMLVSNIFFGQGSWTPWQMFAMGMLGFLAGHIFKQEGEISKKKKWGICIYGFLAVVLFYGVLMNLSSVIMYQDNINSAMILAALGTGLPFDLIHACGTFVFLMIGTNPLLSILNRVKAKYGFDF
nr:ECF transporter S component [Lachnospiraceae bacterium]